MVDYNQSLSVAEAIRRVQFLEEEALVWVEEPTRADDFAGHARIAAECRTPIQIGENLWGPHDLTKTSLGCLRLVGLLGGSARLAKFRLRVYPSRVICSRKSARSWRVHHNRTGWSTRIGPHRFYSDPWKLKMVSRFRKGKPAAESRRTKTPFSDSGFARARQLHRMQAVHRSPMLAKCTSITP
jgi:Enolase C-terminal domain-like